MRERWACPDLKAEPKAGRFQSVPGSSFQFDDCPAAHLRSRDEVIQLRIRRGIEPFADHLIEGVTHPSNLVAEIAMELKNGARTFETLTPKVRELVNLHMAAESEREAHDAQMREDKRNATRQ